MRLSADDLPPNMPRVVRIFLDGRQIIGCYSADEERGEVVIFVRDERGHIKAPFGEVETATLRGEVRVDIPDYWKHQILARRESVQTVRH